MLGRFEGTIASGAYPAIDSPQLEVKAEPRSVLIINHDPAIANDAFVSFDGTTDNFRLPGGANITFRTPYKRVDLRRGSGGNPLVQVISEG